MKEVLILGVAGALGTISRYAVGNASVRFLGADFPYGTLIVNILGCFLLGMIMHFGLSSDSIPNHFRVAATIGFLGAFTTFSTFGYETMRHMEQGSWTPAFMNIAANLGLGLLAVWAGISVAKILLQIQAP